jgi:DNA-damage-inducible protein D
MKKEIIAKLHTQFEEIVQVETETGTEFWFARDLQEALGYKEWRNTSNWSSIRL